ncbi:hypothetical protein OF83DRAFT_327492 [Amylostereum chailletii]|nr:hypothetical protein OF83DRAFT_327492 [Amylostereum chailletii]
MPPPSSFASNTVSASSKSSTTKSSRYSLNFASVGKALADVINNKDTRETAADKASKKGKTSDRRLSAIVDNNTASRRSSIGARPPSRDVTSPGATITRASRRQSAIVADVPTGAVSEDGVLKSATSPAANAATARRASLRPRNPGNNLNQSALPKYRPRSVLVEPKKQISPPRAGTRRRHLSSSDDEKNDTKAEVVPADDKSTRSITPPPQPALQTNIAISISPSTPVSKVKIPSRKGTSPSRKGATPTGNGSPAPGTSKSAKAVKAPPSANSGIPRPPSSASASSSSSVHTPRTPQTPTPSHARNKSSISPGKTNSPLRNALPRREDSPLGKFSNKKTPARQSKPKPAASPADSLFTEGSSMDSVNDVEFMLGAMVSPTAPTPAVPRIRKEGRRLQLPETPSRGNNVLPTRANMSYLSPLPPTSDRSPRPARPARAGNDRGSLLSWDQMAAMGDLTLGEGEVQNMLNDIPAPFSATASPTPSVLELEVPDSPSLSALPSPVGYTSISQILLPDVTPSPAPIKQHRMSPERLHGDASMVTMLRLQLASMENIAKERLGQIQILETQLGAAKNMRLRDADELAGQVSTLEEQMRAVLETRDRISEEQNQQIYSLEEQIQRASAAREYAVQEAVKMAVADAARLQASVVAKEGRKWEAALVAREASARWDIVRETAESELELVASSREMLDVLLAGLDASQRQLCITASV